MIERLESIWQKPEARARILKWVWLISTGFVLFGFALIIYWLFVR